MPEMQLSTELIGRLRINEARLANLRERLVVTDNNMIDEFRKISEQVRDINVEMKEIKNDLFKLRETLKEVVNEMSSFARSSEIKVLEKYINTWNPLNFVTEKEVLNLIKNVKPEIKDR
ncbi:hypothetical protein HYT56_00815 [Candidatus Woesearchaeota archaeon]|nr:hypothetical protein [Candidatus Woesearchaeota archaeon]